jgi:phosphoribosylaminoimidazole-succinocarboxamide synthase
MTDIVRAQLSHTLRDTDFSLFGTRYHGKVRDTYSEGDRLILITTDRISAFDHVLKQSIPFKGQVLNQLAAFFFDSTRDIVPNHVISVPDPNVTVAMNCRALPIEFVVRGYLSGHAWRVYDGGGRSVCGEPLLEGLVQNSRLPRPILTPATKAESGHDEDISREEILDRNLLSRNTLDYLEDTALRLFERGTEMAQARGLILVDTKYEFGLLPDGSVQLIDEIHTPDSSRYFYSDTYERLLSQNLPQRQLSKEFVREWLMSRNFRGLEGQTLPDLDDDFRIEAALRYIELFETVTCSKFEPDLSTEPEERIRRNLIDYIAHSGVVPSTHLPDPST